LNGRFNEDTIILKVFKWRLMLQFSACVLFYIVL
jgi:hypothetical protein